MVQSVQNEASSNDLPDCASIAVEQNHDCESTSASLRISDPIRGKIAFAAPSRLSRIFSRWVVLDMGDNIEHVISYWVPV
jgi:hypothetical protein